jgi:hypothetical protein
VEVIKDRCKIEPKLSYLAAHFGFSFERINCFHPAVGEYGRTLYLSEDKTLVMKRMNRHHLTPDFKYLCPTLYLSCRDCKEFQIQPFCEVGEIGNNSIWAEEFKKELPEFDCHPENVRFLNGLPALIDW